MANIDAPRGLKLYQIEGKTARSRSYTKTAAVAIYKGALLKRVAAGTVQKHEDGDTDPIVGVAAAYAAAADSEVFVYDDPEATFIIQSADAYAVADNGLNADIIDGTDNASLLYSGQEIDMSSKATTATLPLKIIGLAPEINGQENAAGSNADLLVKINAHERSAGVAGI